jgi:hypothetical protein
VDLEYHYDNDDDALNNRVSPSVRVCESVPSPRFYPLPSLFKQIPYRARTSFIDRIKPILTEYVFAHSQKNNNQCNQLTHQFLDFPRLFLAIQSKKGGRQIDPVNSLIHRLDHRNYRDQESFVADRRQAPDEEKRIRDDDARAVKRVIGLVKIGDMKRAIQTLSSNTPIASINEDTIAELNKLHPKQSQPLPPFPPSNAPRIIVSRSKLSRIIRRKLNNGAAGGPSGWTGKHLQPLVTDKECMEGLAAMIEDICNGVIVDPLLRNRLLACSLTPLQKSNGGIRPVAVGEVLGKLASCYLISVCMKSESYRQLFPSIQEGVGIAGGCENVIHFIRAARKVMGDDTIVITVDFKNAYNMRRRIDMWDSILKHRSESRGSKVNLSYLIRYFHWAYSIPTPLVLPSIAPQSNHLLTLESCEGVRQGANESSLLFSLSMQSIYEESLKGLEIKNVQAKAIQDDFTIVGKPKEAFEVFNRLKESAAQQGMEIQPNKCCILPPFSLPLSESTSTIIDELKGLGLRETPLLHILGATIGQDEDINKTSDLVKEWAEGVSIAENERFFRLLTHRDMPVQIAFRLLILSGLPRLTYLCRVMPPSFLSDATHHFDNIVMKTLFKLCDVNVNMLSDNDLLRITRQAQLKMRNGGLGITPYSDIAPAAYIASLANAMPSILSLFAELGEQNDYVQVTKQKYSDLYHQIRQQIRSIADDNALSSLLPSNKNDFDSTFSSPLPRSHRHSIATVHPSPARFQSTASVAHLQSKLSAAIEKKRVLQYQSMIDRHGKARLLSASQRSASIWLTTLPEEDSLRLSNDQFRAAIRHRLSLSSQRYPKCCECDPSAGPVNESQHPHVCLSIKKEETNKRHELIVFCVSQLCRLAGFPTSLSYSLHRLPNETEIVPDLYVYTGGKTYMIDVSIVYPAGSTYVNAHSADIHSLAAASHRGKEKVRKYESLAHRNGMEFIPFILESFGAIGKEARRFISEIADETPESNQFYAYCLRRLSIVLQRGNSLMQMNGMKRLLINANSVGRDRQQAIDITIPPMIMSSNRRPEEEERKFDVYSSTSISLSLAPLPIASPSFVPFRPPTLLDGPALRCHLPIPSAHVISTL